MKAFSSLTNRIFLATALLAVASIGIAVVTVHLAVRTQAERELLRGLNEAATLVEEYRRLLFEHFSREAQLVADLPRLKAAVAERDPPTVQPIAEEYHRQLATDVFLVTDAVGRPLATIGSFAEEPSTHVLPVVQTAAQGGQASMFVQQPGGILQVVSVPIWIDPRYPEILGTLSVGVSLDDRAASQFRALTNSEIAFGIDGRIQAATLPPATWPGLAGLLGRDGITQTVELGGEDFIAMTRPLGGGRPADSVARTALSEGSPVATAVILRSRTERLAFLSAIHRTLGITAILAVLAATLISYGIARTVTRPLGDITATMREMASTGDLTRRIEPAGGRWEDEDARLLAATFNAMTDSIARFQREAAQKERLSSLGRLSTVVAHEIRNPLMIIKTVLRSLRGGQVETTRLNAAVQDIDEEVNRLNRIVADVLDFARPIPFEYGPTDLNTLCRDAVAASGPGEADGVRLRLDRSLPEVITDGERLRAALVNVLVNARQAVGAGRPQGSPAIELETTRLGPERVQILVRDEGVGIDPADLPQLFDPYFTTRRGGTGLGLAISRNIIEGLGGSITLTSRRQHGTEVRIELPRVSG